jgi:Schitoviridae HNH endonuclease
MSTPEANKALSKAKIHLMCKPDTTFFSVVCLSLPHVWDDTIQTACTDGTKISYNPKFFMEDCSSAERIGLILHETLHVVFSHMLRLGSRDPVKWNKAADYAINLIIVDAGIKLPEGGRLDTKYAGMSAEQIYELLPDEDDPDFDPDIIFGAEGPDLQGKIDDILVQATMQSNAANDKSGSIPAEIERYVKELTNSQVPWHRILSAFFTKLARTEYSFRKPNRRFFPEYILPTLQGEGISNGAVAVDASGSVTDEQFQHFVSETSNIIKAQRPDTLHFLQFTTQLVGEPTQIKKLSDLKKLDFSGCGGTHIDPVMEWAKENKPNWLIIFTDGYYSEPTIKPKVPVIWVIHGNPDYKAPFGKIIHYTFKDKT